LELGGHMEHAHDEVIALLWVKEEHVSHILIIL
jgi:hypothetical protein